MASFFRYLSNLMKFLVLVPLLLCAVAHAQQPTLAERAGSTAAALSRSAAAPIAKPLLDASTGFAKGLLAPVGEDIQASTDASLVDLQVLAPRGMVLVRAPHCRAHVDLIQSTFRLRPPTGQRNHSLEQSVTSAQQAGCVRAKTPLETMDPSLRIFYEPRRAKLKHTPACAKYREWADEIAFDRYTADEKRVALSKLFLAAQEEGCS